jgi:prephenate dehydrogenase
VEHLPAILAFALMETMFGQPTWRDLRKAAGPAFRLGTELTSTDAATHADLFLANRENLVRWMDEFAVSLASLRRALDEEESQELAERLGNALEERQQWLLDQERGQWQEGPRAEMPSRGSLLEGLLGGFWRRKREGEER